MRRYDCFHVHHFQPQPHLSPSSWRKWYRASLSILRNRMWTSLTVSLVYHCGERGGRPKANNVGHLSAIQMLCTIATVVLLRLCDWPVYFRAQLISLVHTVVAYVVFKPPWKVLLCFSFGHLTFAFSLTNTALIVFNYNSPSFQTALSLQSTEVHVQNARLILFPKNHVCM